MRYHSAAEAAEAVDMATVAGDRAEQGDVVMQSSSRQIPLTINKCPERAEEQGMEIVRDMVLAAAVVAEAY